VNEANILFTIEGEYELDKELNITATENIHSKDMGRKILKVYHACTVA
jgi:hypothetical protein